MAYPPTLPPDTRTNTTPQANNHPTDHNQIVDAIQSLINVLGSNPAGGAADLTTRLAGIKLVSAYKYSLNLANVTGGQVDQNLPTLTATAAGWAEISIDPVYWGYVSSIGPGFGCDGSCLLYTNSVTGPDNGAYQSAGVEQATLNNPAVWGRMNGATLIFPVNAPGSYVPTFRGIWSGAPNCYFQGLIVAKLYAG
jgi:hypothetical protein